MNNNELRNHLLLYCDFSAEGYVIKNCLTFKIY
jgi:hypothetical protein